jgi:TRAP-type uncharacterized transport system fused permease subunit
VTTATLGMIGLGAAAVGYLVTHMRWYERVLSIAGGLLLIDPGIVTDLVGLGILIVVGAVQAVRVRRTRHAPAARA